MASNSDNLYVTYVDVDRDLLKIWGQRNRVAATYIEKQLSQLLPDFNRAPHPNPAQIHKGMFCFAKYTDDNYYRARVISRVQADSVGVLFVDYGNKDIIKLSNIRIQEGNEGEVLAKMAEQAEEYYLSGATAPPTGWTKEIVSEIRRDICYEEFFYQIICEVVDQKILEIQFHNEDFSSYLVRKQLASPLSLPAQKQMILNYCSLVSTDAKPEPVRSIERIPFAPSMPPPNMRAPLRPPNERILQLNYEKNNRMGNFSHPPPPVHYSSPRSVNSVFPQINSNIPKNSYFPPVNHPSNPVPISASSPQPIDPGFNPILNNHFNPLQMVKENKMPFSNNNSNNINNTNNINLSSNTSNIIQLLAQQVKQYIAEDNAKTESETQKIPHHYINSVLEVGSTYNVLISFIDDGPWSFSIQLLSSETELQKLMDELSSTELSPIKPPIILGHPCIASSALYGNLCRGVVVSVSHSAVKVYFVDFGNTEDLPSSSIYELPVKFFRIRVLSQKFSLSGLQKVAYSDDIKKFFKEVVQDELLMLRVTSLEDDNLPTCELYLKDKNIKRILNEKIRELRSSSIDDFPKVGDTENVLVTWIVSPQKFFVQLHKRDADLAALKKELTEVETKGQQLTYQQLSVGFKCVCQYKNDGHWYRAVITSVDSESAITVFYVDYGNTEIVNLSRLRRISSSSLINQMSNQAIQCTLKGFENKPFDQEVTTKLEALIVEKELQMKIVSLERELLCVQLFENGKDIASELIVSTPPKLTLLETSSQNQSDELTVWSSPVSADAQGKQSAENGEFSERSDSRGSRGGRNRQKNKGGRQMNYFQSFNSPNRQTPAQSKRRYEDTEPWRNDKTKENHWNEPNQNSYKPRVPKQNDGVAEWENYELKTGGSKSNRDSGRFDRPRGPRQPRNGFEQGNEGVVGERKKFDEKKFNGEAKRFDRNKGRENEFKKKFDRNDNKDRNLDERKRKEILRKPVKKEDSAPRGSKYEEKVIKLNTCERGIITYYFSPHEFYVQLLSQEEEFKRMMTDIQVYYNDKYSHRDPVQAGDLVIAQFSLDKVLYRAEVIKPSPVTVRYVDYGNQEPVQPKGIWLLDKQFLKLPKQVIKCRLSNIRPVGFDWPPPGGGIDKFFELPEYKCTFLSLDNDMYEIVMEGVEDGKDVASEIIAAGLALPGAPKLDVPEIEFILLPKQILRLYVCNVESPSNFHVVLNPVGFEVIRNGIATFCEQKQNLVPLSEALIKPKRHCLVTDDDVTWYRGRVVSTDGNKALVWLRDRGDNIEVEVNRVMNIPDYLKVFQSQAVQCSLHGTSNVENENFKMAVEHKYHLVYVASVFGESLSVILYNDKGEKLDFQTCSDFPETVEPISQLPIISQNVPVMISHIESPKEIYVQRSADFDAIANLSEQMSSFYSKEGGSLDKVKVKGMPVAAKSVVYETWYRGQLMSSLDDGLEIFYIDYGNTEILPEENVKKLDFSFLSANAYCRRLSLDAEFETSVNEDLKNKILELCQDKELMTYFINNDGKFLCEFILNDERITSHLKSVGLLLNESVMLAEATMSVKETTLEQPSIDRIQSDSKPDELKVFVSHIDNPDHFWVHKESTLNELQKFQDKLQKSCETFPVNDKPRVDDIVAALFSNTWYRAKVKNVENEVITVQFIDYGNTLDIDLSSSSVKELTDEFVKVPVFATPFGLKGTWSEVSTPKFEEIILRHEDPVTVVILEDSDPAVVDLFQNGQSVAELLKEDEWKLEKEQIEEGQEAEDLITAYITYSRSPGDFYIQRESCTDDLKGLTKKLLDAENFESPLTVEENRIYAAKFPEDGAWYRAKVTKQRDGVIQVHFIDYGNTSKVSEVKYLPDGLADIPNLAERCSLLFGDSCDDWSEAACEKFAEFADGRELKMKVEVNLFKKLLVDLFHEGVSVREKLEALCENDGRVEVYVPHAVSPTEFYIQYADDEHYKKIVEKLENEETEDLEERIPGTLCQARFVDDGYWYRAKIERNLDEGCEVCFIDFGNVSVSTELKKLPKEIEEIPPRATRCSLKIPQSHLTKSAEEEFVRLTREGAALFRARIVTPGDVSIVSLKLGGRIVEETLNVGAIEEANGFGLSTNPGEGFLTSVVDDGKNSKKNLITEDYLISDLAVGLTGGSVENETDEEKRVIGGDESEGFKSDDERGGDGIAPSGLVNATDKDVVERENASEVSTEDSRDGVLEIVTEGEEADEKWEQASAEDIAGVVQNGESHKSNGYVNGTHKIQDFEYVSNQKKDSRNKVHKIVPGCISRGEEEDALLESSSEMSYNKVKYSEKLVPGSISRGVSLESMAKEDEPFEEAPVSQASRSAPTTPKLSRRNGSKDYVKIDPSDRLVPGCISTGASLLCNPSGEKIPANDKIVSGAVNGSFEN